jgi:hypothetical protein
MVQAFPGPQDVVGVRRCRVRCGLLTIPSIVTSRNGDWGYTALLVLEREVSDVLSRDLKQGSTVGFVDLVQSAYTSIRGESI